MNGRFFFPWDMGGVSYQLKVYCIDAAQCNLFTCVWQFLKIEILDHLVIGVGNCLVLEWFILVNALNPVFMC